MTDHQDKQSSFPFSITLLIAAIIAGGVFTFYSPLESLRPSKSQKEIEQQIEEEKVLARLWQDPFQAVEGYRKDTEAIHPKFSIPNIMDGCQKSGIFKSQEDIKDVLIMPVMISAGHYTEDAEERLRTRYAVLSALHAAGYQPKNATHIGVFKAQINRQERLIPYEWYLQDTLKMSDAEATNIYEAVLVLWLGDEYFSNDRLGQMELITKQVLEVVKEFVIEVKDADGKQGSDRVDCKILGPKDSLCLEEICKQALDEKNKEIAENIQKLYELSESENALFNKEKKVNLQKKQLERKERKEKNEVRGIWISLSKKFKDLDNRKDSLCKNKRKKLLEDVKSKIKNEQREFESEIKKLESELESAKKKHSDKIEEIKKILKNSSEKKFILYSPWANADPFFLIYQIGQRMSKREKPQKSISNLIQIKKELEEYLEKDAFYTLLFPTESDISLTATIHNDSQLTDELVDELTRRKINLSSNSSDHILLISEWDTFYGRALPTSFAMSVQKYREREEGYSDFFKGEFKEPLNPERLYKKIIEDILNSIDFRKDEFKQPHDIVTLCIEIERADYGVPPFKNVSSHTIEWLNELLKVPDFYDKIPSEKRREITSGKIIKELNNKTVRYRKKSFSKLNNDEKYAIKLLNRLVLAHIYPGKAPDLIPLLPLNASRKPIDWLNEFLTNPGLYDFLGKVRGKDRLSNIIKETQEDRSIGFSRLSEDTQWETKRLNRLLLEKAYSEETPQRIGNTWPERIHTITYMRGIDGKLPNRDSEISTGGNSNSDKKKSSPTDFDYFNPKFEQPQGQDQFDYMRRLTEKVKNIVNDRDKIRAIGIMGSDVYDKLLILRALRKEFRNTIFFTTDLDARLWHHTELPFTRNLIVASSYGLQLRHNLQKDIPPFRSVYQTSAFVAALQALGSLKEDDINLNKISPRIFEIGYRGEYDLSSDHTPETELRKEELYLHPDRTYVQIKFFICLFVPPIIILGWFFWQFLPDQNDFSGFSTYLKFMCYWKCLGIIGGAFYVLFVALAIKSSLSADGEPITFLDGISIWPTELIRLLNGFLGTCFFALSLQHVKRNKKEIAHILSEQKGEGFFADLKEKWHTFEKSNETWKRYRTVAIITCVHLLLGFAFIYKYGNPLIPGRGSLCFSLDRVILISSLFLTFFLFWHVVFDTFKCRKFIKELFQLKGNEQNDDYWYVIIKVIAKRTEVNAKMIKYPFILLLIFCIARYNFIDNWKWTLPLAVVVVLSILIVLYSAIMLFREAKGGRQKVIDQLKDKLLKLMKDKKQTSSESNNEKLERELGFTRFIIEDIQNTRNGAFATLSNNPILFASLTPLGGMGIINLLQHAFQ